MASKLGSEAHTTHASLGSFLDISQALYLNIPRITAIAAAQGHDLRVADIPREGLHSMGAELGSVLFDLGIALHDVQIDVVPVTSMKEIRRLSPGSRFAFEHAVRTQGIVRPPSQARGNPEPLVYWGTKRTRLVMPIELRWVTFGSAFAHLRPAGGKIRLGGIAAVISHEATRTNASLVALGMPRIRPGSQPSNSR
jgi:hypothetical protein